MAGLARDKTVLLPVIRGGEGHCCGRNSIYPIGVSQLERKREVSSEPDGLIGHHPAK